MDHEWGRRHAASGSLSLLPPTTDANIPIWRLVNEIRPPRKDTLDGVFLILSGNALSFPSSRYSISSGTRGDADRDDEVIVSSSLDSTSSVLVDAVGTGVIAPLNDPIRTTNSGRSLDGRRLILFLTPSASSSSHPAAAIATAAASDPAVVGSSLPATTTSSSSSPRRRGGLVIGGGGGGGPEYAAMPINPAISVAQAQHAPIVDRTGSPKAKTPHTNEVRTIADE